MFIQSIPKTSKTTGPPVQLIPAPAPRAHAELVEEDDEPAQDALEELSAPEPRRYSPDKASTSTTVEYGTFSKQRGRLCNIVSGGTLIDAWKFTEILAIPSLHQPLCVKSCTCTVST